MKSECIGNGRVIIDIESADELLLFINSIETIESIADLINKSDHERYCPDHEIYFYHQEKYIISIFDEYPVEYEQYPAMHYRLNVHKAIDYLIDLVPHKMKNRI